MAAAGVTWVPGLTNVLANVTLSVGCGVYHRGTQSWTLDQLAVHGTEVRRPVPQQSQQGLPHQMDQIPQSAPVCHYDKHKTFHWTQRWSSHLLQAGHCCRWQCRLSCRIARSKGL